MRKPSREDFKLKKAKLLKGGGMQVIFACTYQDDDGEVHGESIDITKQDRRHPDIDAVAEELKEHLLHGAGHLSVVHAFAERLKPDKSMFGKFNAIKKRLIEAEKEKTKVTTISFSGEDHLFGVIISGSYKSFQGASVALNTPRIVFSQDAIGIEKTVEQLCDTFADEAYDFLYDNKKWQAELELE